MSELVNRISVGQRNTPRHPLDRNLPGHWENIRVGQTSDERSAAILVNIRLDEQAIARGIDRATGHPLPTSNLRSVLARLRRLAH